MIPKERKPLIVDSDVANAMIAQTPLAVFLASDDAGWVTGELVGAAGSMRWRICRGYGFSVSCARFKAMNASFRLLIGLTVSAMLCACSGTGSPQSICNGPVQPAEPMVYPIPNATGVPDGNFTLVLGASVQTGLMLNGAGPLASAAVPNPLPTPNAPESPAPFGYSGYTVGPLAAATTYTLTETVAGGTPCQATETFGQFTTR